MNRVVPEPTPTTEIENRMKVNLDYLLLTTCPLTALEIHFKRNLILPEGEEGLVSSSTRHLLALIVVHLEGLNFN